MAGIDWSALAEILMALLEDRGEMLDSAGREVGVEGDVRDVGIEEYVRSQSSKQTWVR